jgi:anthranilate phosphoribosyltransferase
LGRPTIFNLLGPLTNPAGAEYQLLGVGRPGLRPLMAAALARLGTKRAAVVSGEEGLGEVSLAGPTAVTDINAGSIRELRWTPEDFGLSAGSLETLTVSGPDQSAAIVREVLARRPGPARDIVVLNAAAALWTVGRCDTPRAAAELAAEAIDAGAAARLLEQLVKATHR